MRPFLILTWELGIRFSLRGDRYRVQIPDEPPLVKIRKARHDCLFHTPLHIVTSRGSVPPLAPNHPCRVHNKRLCRCLLLFLSVFALHQVVDYCYQLARTLPSVPTDARKCSAPQMDRECIALAPILSSSSHFYCKPVGGCS